jgi:hypothetical protein
MHPGLTSLLNGHSADRKREQRRTRTGTPHDSYYTFSTWPNSSSTGVARPKIVTETRTRDFS